MTIYFKQTDAIKVWLQLSNNEMALRLILRPTRLIKVQNTDLLPESNSVVVSAGVVAVTSEMQKYVLVITIVSILNKLPDWSVRRQAGCN